MIGKQVAPPDTVLVSGRGGRAEESIWIFGVGALVLLGGDRTAISYKPKCLSGNENAGKKSNKTIFDQLQTVYAFLFQLNILPAFPINRESAELVVELFSNFYVFCLPRGMRSLFLWGAFLLVEE